MKVNFRRCVDQITQNVIVSKYLENLNVVSQRKIAPRCRIASGLSLSLRTESFVNKHPWRFPQNNIIIIIIAIKPTRDYVKFFKHVLYMCGISRLRE
jgi:hypothetical protein